MIWTLKISVALECVGTWDWMVRWEETPILHWLLDPTDVGGLGWNEHGALIVQQVVGYATLFAGLLILVRPSSALLLPVTLLQASMAIAAWQLAEVYQWESQWISHSTMAMIPIAAHLARIAAPLGLLLLCSWQTSQPLSASRMILAFNILRWSIAITFFAHGIEAWQHHPQFVDILIFTFKRNFGMQIPQAVAESLLSVIGGSDILVAILCLSTRWRAVWWWMALWGAVTAFSRIASFGLEVGWNATFMRIPHVGVPLAVALSWDFIETQGTAKSVE